MNANPRTTDLTGVKAILFDMDGVLIDAKDWHYEALNDALKLFGFEISRTEHLAVYDGLPTRKKLEMLTRVRGLPAKLHGLINELKQRRTLELTYQRCRPVYHHQFALSQLKRQGLSLVVCSNSIRRTVEVMMEQAGLDQLLDFVLSNEDVGRPKPDPEIYTLAMSRLGLRPEDCLIIEDNEHGLQAARASGARVLEVASPADVSFDRIVRAIRETAA